MTTRNIPPFRDPAVLLIDQLKQVYIDGELEPVDTPNYYPKILRKDFTVGSQPGRPAAPTPTRSSITSTAAVRA